MGKNSEVFVLDMGESVKIRELIHKMINLSGLSVKDIKNPLGDIEIQITGLKPGEKLYEELLIGDNPQQTEHPKILRATDPFIPFDKLELELNALKDLLDQNETIKVKNLLVKLLKSYKSNSEIADHIYLEQISSVKNQQKLSVIKKTDDQSIISTKRVFTN